MAGRKHARLVTEHSAASPFPLNSVAEKPNCGMCGTVCLPDRPAVPGPARCRRRPSPGIGPQPLRQGRGGGGFRRRDTPGGRGAGGECGARWASRAAGWGGPPGPGQRRTARDAGPFDGPAPRHQHLRAPRAGSRDPSPGTARTVGAGRAAAGRRAPHGMTGIRRRERLRTPLFSGPDMPLPRASAAGRTRLCRSPGKGGLAQLVGTRRSLAARGAGAAVSGPAVRMDRCRRRSPADGSRPRSRTRVARSR